MKSMTEKQVVELDKILKFVCDEAFCRKNCKMKDGKCVYIQAKKEELKSLFNREGKKKVKECVPIRRHTPFNTKEGLKNEGFNECVNITEKNIDSKFK